MRAYASSLLVAAFTLAAAEGNISSGRGGIQVLVGHHPFDEAVCVYEIDPQNLAESEFTFAGDGHPAGMNYPDEIVLARGLQSASVNGSRLTINAIGTYKGQQARITAVIYDGAKTRYPDSVNIVVNAMDNTHLFHLYGTLKRGDFVVNGQ